MRGNLPGPEGWQGRLHVRNRCALAAPTDPSRGRSAALHGLSIVSTMDRAARLQPLPLLANAAHAEYSDRLLLTKVPLQRQTFSRRSRAPTS